MTHPRLTAAAIEIVAAIVGDDAHQLDQYQVKLVASLLEKLSDFMERKGYVDGLRVAAELATNAAKQIQPTVKI